MNLIVKKMWGGLPPLLFLKIGDGGSRLFLLLLVGRLVLLRYGATRTEVRQVYLLLLTRLASLL